MIKLKKNGFTLVELVASFSLALVIMFFLFQIVLTVKELYVSAGMKTEMLIKQANLEKKIGIDLREKYLTNISSCGEECYAFSYGELTKELKVDRDHNMIIYGDYQIEVLEGSEIGELSIDQTILDTEEGKNNTILMIDLPITNKAVTEQNIGIYMLYQYNNRVSSFDL